MFLDRYRPLYSTEGAGGGSPPAAPPATPPAAPPASPPAAPPAEGQAAAGASMAYRPDGLPDHLLGKTDKETIDNLAKAALNARKAIGDFGELPASPKDYAFEPTEKVKPYLSDVSKDPVFAMVTEAAHKAGIGTKQFAPFINTVLEAMVAGNFVEDPWDPLKEQEALEPSITDPAERAKAVDRRIRDNAAWLQSLEAKGMPKVAVAALEGSLDRAAAVQAVEWFRAQMRETTPILNAPGGGEAITEGQLKERNRDPRNDPGSSKYDPRFAAETTALYRRFYGDAPRA